MEKVYNQVIEAVGSLDEPEVGFPADQPRPHLSQSFKGRHPCPRIEEESESDLTEHASRDSCASGSRGQLQLITTVKEDRQEDEDEVAASAPGPSTKQKQSVSKSQPKPRLSGFAQRKSAEPIGPQKDSLQSEDTQDATQELPSAETPTKRPGHSRNGSETWTVRPGIISAYRNPAAQTITKKLREFGLKKPLKSSMVSTNSEEGELPADGGIRRSQTRPENKDRDSEVAVPDDRNPLRWLFIKPKKANPASVKDRILATLGLPSSARDCRARKPKEATQSFDASRGRWKNFSESCVFTSGEKGSSQDQP